MNMAISKIAILSVESIKLAMKQDENNQNRFIDNSSQLGKQPMRYLELTVRIYLDIELHAHVFML